MKVVLKASSKLPTPFGEFSILGFEEVRSGKEHLALSFGDLTAVSVPLIRVHSECLTGDALFSMRCDCGAQLRLAMEMIAAAGHGAILYLRQEGRGIGLLNKLKAYELQDKGADTVEANEQLGFDADLREYTICQDMLNILGITQCRLLTNNPKKLDALEKMGIQVVERIPLKTGKNPHNQRYLETKTGKLGHIF